MARWYTVSEVLDYIFDGNNADEEGGGQKNHSEDGFQEEVSESEDDIKYNPDQ